MTSIISLAIREAKPPGQTVPQSQASLYQGAKKRAIFSYVTGRKFYISAPPNPGNSRALSIQNLHFLKVKIFKNTYPTVFSNIKFLHFVTIFQL